MACVQLLQLYKHRRGESNVVLQVASWCCTSGWDIITSKEWDEPNLYALVKHVFPGLANMSAIQSHSFWTLLENSNQDISGNSCPTMNLILSAMLALVPLRIAHIACSLLYRHIVWRPRNCILLHDTGLNWHKHPWMTPQDYEQTRRDG